MFLKLLMEGINKNIYLRNLTNSFITELLPPPPLPPQKKEQTKTTNICITKSSTKKSIQQYGVLIILQPLVKYI